MSATLTVKNLSMSFEDKAVFSNVDFSLKEGSRTALLGANGTGKTTIIRILMGMLKPTTGLIDFNSDVKIGYVPQFRNIDSDYPLSIRSFVELNTPLFKSKKMRKKIDRILDETNLTSIQNTRMGEASGGQKQRAYLAKALIDDPNFIILDEATASLDPNAKVELMELIKHLNDKRHVTVLFTTHDIPLARKYMGDYLLFQDKTLVAGEITDLSQGGQRVNVYL